MAKCRNCLIIRYFLVAVLMLIIIGLVFTENLKYLSFINPEQVAYLIFIFGILLFLAKTFKHYKNKLFISYKTNKIRNMTRKSSKGMTGKKID